MNHAGESFADRAARLEAHAASCQSCAERPLPLRAVAQRLDAADVAVDAAALSLSVMQRARPELQRLARWAWWRHVLASIALALLPLPLVLLSDIYLLSFVYDGLRFVLPDAIAFFMITAYGITVVLLFAATYAAIPILLARGTGLRAATLA